jgi:hypothetical protein
MRFFQTPRLDAPLNPASKKAKEMRYKIRWSEGSALRTQKFVRGPVIEIQLFGSMPLFTPLGKFQIRLVGNGVNHGGPLHALLSGVFVPCWKQCHAGMKYAIKFLHQLMAGQPAVQNAVV